MTPTLSFRGELERWATQLSFAPDDKVAWGAQHVHWSSEGVRIKPSAGYPLVVGAAAELLYDRAYLRAHEGVRPPADRFAQQAFAARLHEANATKSAWENGWRLVQRGEKEHVVRRGERTRTVLAADYEDGSEGGAGRLRIVKGTSRVRPGWYYVRSEQEYAPRGRPIQRVYWNVGRAGAGALVHAISSEMNGARVPFHFKIVDDPSGYTRADSAVLYVERARWDDARPALERAHAAVAPYLRAHVPSLAKRFARGVAGADDPPAPNDVDPPTESFGQNRCRLVAEGVWDAGVGATSEARAAAVLARLEREGLDLDAPYVNPGAKDVTKLALVDAPLPTLDGGAP